MSRSSSITLPLSFGQSFGRSFGLPLVLSVTLLTSGCAVFKGSEKPDAGPAFSEQIYYERAQKSLLRNQLEDASIALEALDTYYPTGVYTEQAQLDLMYTRFRQSDYTSAVSTAERFIRLYPNNPQLDYALYLRGVANMEIGFDSLLRYTSLQQAHRDVGFLRIAYDNFNELLQKYPNSRYRQDAIQRLQHINQQFAESEMNVARYNVKRGAWVGAIQRARWVLEYYPQTPQIPEAIATLGHSYQQLGMPEQAAQYIELLRLNDPSLVQGDQINLRAAQYQPSWLNRVTLGIAGGRSKSVTSTGSSTDSVTQTISQRASAVPAPPQLAPPTSTAEGIRIIPSLQLGLPAESNTNSSGDSQPADQRPVQAE